jgi:hypothetical protein
MTQEQPKNTVFDVFLSVKDGFEAHQVTAAYVTYSEMDAPGYIQLRDEDNHLAALVHSGFAALIRRRADPDRSLA